MPNPWGGSSFLSTRAGSEWLSGGGVGLSQERSGWDKAEDGLKLSGTKTSSSFLYTFIDKFHLLKNRQMKDNQCSQSAFSFTKWIISSCNYISACWFEAFHFIRGSVLRFTSSLCGFTYHLLCFNKHWSNQQFSPAGNNQAFWKASLTDWISRFTVKTSSK